MVIFLFIFQLLTDIKERLIKVDSLIDIYQKEEFYYFQERNLSIDSFNNYWVIGYKEGRKKDLEILIEKIGGKIIKESKTGGNYLLVYLPFFQIIKEDYINYFEKSVKLKSCFSPNDEFYKYQWDKWLMYSELIWDFEIGKKDIIVAICDQGVDYYHPDLRDNFSFELIGYDFVDDDSNPYPKSEEEIHGTHVAGIIAGVINNHLGISGWAQVRLLAVRVLNEKGEGSDFDVAEGIRWATDNGAKIINLSLGASSYSSCLKEAVEYAYKKGVLLVGASGNNGSANILYPAKFKEVIACGALDKNNSLASFSNYGKEQELVACGVEILSTLPHNQYGLLDGTSMSAPQITGIASLLLSSFPSLTNYQLRAILNAGTIDLGDKGWDRYYGFGLSNAYYTYLIAKEYVYREYSKRIEKKQNYLKEEFYNILGNKIKDRKKKKIYFLKKGKSFQKRLDF